MNQVVDTLEKLNCKENLSYAEKLEIRALRKCIQKLLRQLVNLIEEDDTLSSDHIIELLMQMKNFDIQFFLVNYLVSKSQCEQAKNLIRGKESCNEKESRMKNILLLAINVKCGVEVEFTQNELDQIIDLSSKGYTYNGFLYSLYFELTNERIPLPELFEIGGDRTDPRSISSKEESVIQVFPNPFNDVINIESTYDKLDLYLYNSSGRLIFSEKIEEGIQPLDLSKEKNGLYFIHIPLLSGDKKIFKVLKI